MAPTIPATSAKAASEQTDDDMRRKRAMIGQFKGQLTRAEKYAAEQAGQVLIEEDAVMMRLELLRNGLQRYKEVALELQLLVEEDDDQCFEEDDVEERCLAVMAQLKSILRNSVRPTARPQDLEAQKEQNFTAVMEESTSVSQHNRLPQLDIPYFDGKNITTFKPFIDIFYAVIDSDIRLTPIQKLFYLRKYVKDEASLLIEGLPLVNESYTQAIKLLKTRYENKSILITHHVNLILDFQPISRGTSAELRQLVSSARQQLGALQGLGQPVNHWDMLMIPIIIRKLDSYTIRAYYAERDQASLPNLEDFLAFIERRAISFEETNIASADIMFKIMMPGKIELNKGNLILLPTKFGYIISGNIEAKNNCFLGQRCSNQVSLHAVMEDKVDSVLQRFWEEQHVPQVGTILTDKESLCEAADSYIWCQEFGLPGNPLLGRVGLSV